MPNRIIKECTCTSETIDKMTWFEECFYHRLWTACDDYGRMDARPAILKSKLFPLKERLAIKDVENALHRMVDIGCVMLYECDSKPYLYLPSWEVHQTIRAKKSKYPAPPEIICKQTKSDVTVIQSNTNPESESESKKNNDNNNARARVDIPTDQDVAVVISDFLDRINPMASKMCLDELANYAKSLGKSVCLRAFDVALDAKAANWNYIRAILRDCTQKGITCIADWEDNESKRTQKSDAKKSGRFEYESGSLEGSL